MIENLNKKICLLNAYEKNLIKNFLVSEICDENVDETINFLYCNDDEKKQKFRDDLNQEINIDNILFLDGNQYIIGNKERNVFIVDYVSELNGLDHLYTRAKIDLEDIILFISNKKNVLSLI